jgi:hypothetical protein
MKSHGSSLRRYGRLGLALGVAGLLSALVGGDTATAQQQGGGGQGQYVTEAAARLNKLIAQANRDGYKLSDNNFSIGGGWLKQSENNWVPLFTVTLQQGRGYRLLAAGDADARDVDLQLVDENNKVVAEDAGTEPTAVLNIRPNQSQKYLVRVRLYASEKNLPCVCLGIVMDK